MLLVDAHWALRTIHATETKSLVGNAVPAFFSPQTGTSLRLAFMACFGILKFGRSF